MPNDQGIINLMVRQMKPRLQVQTTEIYPDGGRVLKAIVSGLEPDTEVEYHWEIISGGGTLEPLQDTH